MRIEPYEDLLFTIQNVPIKLYVLSKLSLKRLEFTIQNVPIKYDADALTEFANSLFTIQNVPIKCLSLENMRT